MVALTLVAVVVARPPPDRLDRRGGVGRRSAPRPPSAVVVFFGALTLGRLDTAVRARAARDHAAPGRDRSRLGALAVVAAFTVGGRLGYGPFAGAAGRRTTRARPAAARPAADGWLRPGRLLGLPLVWAAACLALIPLGVYVISYIPWAFIGTTSCGPAVPAGHSGQTLLDLTGQMYATTTA